MLKILVVDDDPQISGLLKRGLAFEGYDVETASDGLEALAKVREKEPALIILDILMPGIDGFEVAKRLRRGSQVPILMLTAKGMVADKVTGLNAGADDYMVKPFDFDELLARIKALIRRQQSEQNAILRFADISLNPATRQVDRAGKSIELTAKEFDLLDLFLRHPRQVLRREQIYERVWGFDFEGESNVIEVYMRYLRTKLEAGGRPRIIHTIRSVGYVLKN